MWSRGGHLLRRRCASSDLKAPASRRFATSTAPVPRAGVWSAWSLLPLFFAAISLNATSPKLNSISPPGGQRGTELELKFSGERFHDAQEIILYNPGIEVLKIEENKTNSLTARVKIAPTCHLGEHPFRVRTATGLS